MPFKSDAQRKWMYATNPKMAAKWSKETPKGKDLPERVSARKTAIMKRAKAGN